MKIRTQFALTLLSILATFVILIGASPGSTKPIPERHGDLKGGGIHRGGAMVPWDSNDDDTDDHWLVVLSLELQYDVSLSHELGHLLGLPDITDPAEYKRIMYDMENPYKIEFTTNEITTMRSLLQQ